MTRRLTDTLAARRRPLAGRVAVVTGAASGIGAATARRLAADGAAVALLARRAERLDELAARSLATTARPPSPYADVTDPDALDAAADAVRARTRPLDLVVANAGVMLAAPFEAGRADEWQRMIDTNLRGLLDVPRLHRPTLPAPPRRGRSPTWSPSPRSPRTRFPSFAVYCATKAAVNGVRRGVRADLAARDVRVTTSSRA